MGPTMWGKDVAEAYDVTSAAMFDPSVLDPTIDLLFERFGDRVADTT